MPPTTLTVDGFDLSALGFAVDDPSSWGDSPTRSWPVRFPPGREIGIFTSTQPSHETRQLEITGILSAATLSAMQAAYDEMRWRLDGGDHEFVFSDRGSRMLVGRVALISRKPVAPALSQRATRIQISVVMADPRILETTATVVAFGAATATPLGVGRSWPVITVTGAGSFTVTYRDSGGTAVATLQVSGATAPVVIDMAAQTITDAGGDAMDALAAGDFFALDPQDGDYPSSAWPTLEVSSGSGSAQYSKAW